MVFSIPIFVEEHTAGANQTPSFTVQPVFQAQPQHRGEKLSRALTKLSNALHQILKELGEDPRHDDLSRWTFNPLLDESTVEVRLELKSGSEKRAFFLVGYSALGRKIYFTPKIPELFFELLPNQTLSVRATEVLTRHFRELEKEFGEASLDTYSLSGKGRLTTIEIRLEPADLAKKKQPPKRAFLFGGEEKKDGERELRRTGRSLSAMYPDDLKRAVGRDEEVAKLAALLGAADRRPVLLVGPRQVGKTAVVHELAYQMRARGAERFGGKREIWLLSPMRLISGMSFLGEWENRVLAILDFAEKKDRVLYFDDMLGLFTAGVSSASDLNVANVLKPALEKRKVRVIGEITPEAWRALRERDRAFADLFQVIPVREPTEAETLRILVNVGRELETEHRCRFGLEVVPTVYEVQRRFGGDAAFPGKAAGFLEKLAVRFAGLPIERAMALYEFQQQNGLQVAFLDDHATLQRDQIQARIARQLVGQPPVVEAFGDVLVALKARLNDPRRPLGTFLLLGPTGVGKTQSAKALAAYLFGSEEKLLRFDMNEYIDGSAAARLTGTFQNPEGLLTSAIRRQPFSVVLLDEIEKAAPEVFDVLLAVLDEGRLTDALGRVADFTQSVILLSSNLGAREARSRMGFSTAHEDPAGTDEIYIKAAESFFRPEFVNRLDRIIPFRPLQRGELEGIARQLLAGVFARDGLNRRDGLLNVTEPAMARLVELGHHPELGARALKRVLEREVAQPIAVRLAELPPGTPMLGTLSLREEGDFDLQMQDLRPVERSVFWTEEAIKPRSRPAQAEWTSGLLEAIETALARIEGDLEVHAPTGRIELNDVSPEQTRYFLCREQLRNVDRLLEAVERGLTPSKKSVSAAKLPKAKPVKLLVRQSISGTPLFDRMRESLLLRQEMEDLASDPMELPDSPLPALLRELSLLEALCHRPTDHRPGLLVFRSSQAGDSFALARLVERHSKFLARLWGTMGEPLLVTANEKGHDPFEDLLKPAGACQAVVVNGVNLTTFLPQQPQTILVRHAGGGLGLITMTFIPQESLEAARETAARLVKTEQGVDLARLGPVVQLLVPHKTILDFRTGLEISAEGTAEDFRAFSLSTLPLSREVLEWTNSHREETHA